MSLVLLHSQRSDEALSGTFFDIANRRLKQKHAYRAVHCHELLGRPQTSGTGAARAAAHAASCGSTQRHIRAVTGSRPEKTITCGVDTVSGPLRREVEHTNSVPVGSHWIFRMSTVGASNSLHLNTNTIQCLHIGSNPSKPN